MPRVELLNVQRDGGLGRVVTFPGTAGAITIRFDPETGLAVIDKQLWDEWVVPADPANQGITMLRELPDLPKPEPTPEPVEEMEPRITFTVRPKEDFSELTVPELRNRLREKDLPVSGKRDDLIERLESS